MEFVKAFHRGAGSSRPVTPGWLMLCALTFFICVTASDSWSDLALLSALLVAASLFLRVGIFVYLRALRTSWILVSVAVVFHMVFRLWFAGEQAHGVLPAALDTTFFVCRLLLLVGMTFLMMNIFSPAEYAESAASRMRFAFGNHGAASASHVVLLSFSMLPQIQEHMLHRKLARRLRGFGAPNGIGDRLEFARTELNAALRYALDYASVLAVVLWSRGFDPRRVIHSAKRRASATGIFAAISFCILCLITLLPSRTV